MGVAMGMKRGRVCGSALRVGTGVPRARLLAHVKMWQLLTGAQACELGRIWLLAGHIAMNLLDRRPYRQVCTCVHTSARSAPTGISHIPHTTCFPSTLTSAWPPRHSFVAPFSVWQPQVHNSIRLLGRAARPWHVSPA